MEGSEPLVESGDDELPPLEVVDGEDDMPPLEEVHELDDDIPPLEEVHDEQGASGVPDLEDSAVPVLPPGMNPEIMKAAQAVAQQQSGAQPSIPGLKSHSKRSRSEKKAKRALMRAHNLHPVPDIARVVIKQNKILFVFDEPEVFKTAKRHYIVFGQAQIQDISRIKRDMIGRNILDETKKIQEEMRRDAELADPHEDEVVAMRPEDDDSVEELIEEIVESDDGEDSDADSDVSLGEVDEKDVQVVMDQASVSRARAIRALKQTGGDIVDAVMALQDES